LKEPALIKGEKRSREPCYEGGGAGLWNVIVKNKTFKGGRRDAGKCKKRRPKELQERRGKVVKKKGFTS